MSKRTKPAKPAKPSKPSKPSTDEQEAAVVGLYARIRELKEELKRLEPRAREQAMDLYEGFGLGALAGPEGIVAINQRAPYRRIDADTVKEWFVKHKYDVEDVKVEVPGALEIRFTPRNGS